MTTSSGSLEIGRQLLHKADNKLPNYRRLTGDRLTERQTESFGHLGHNLNLMRYASTTKTPVLYTFDKQENNIIIRLLDPSVHSAAYFPSNCTANLVKLVVLYTDTTH